MKKNITILLVIFAINPVLSLAETNATKKVITASKNYNRAYVKEDDQKRAIIVEDKVDFDSQNNFVDSKGRPLIRRI